MKCSSCVSLVLACALLLACSGKNDRAVEKFDKVTVIRLANEQRHDVIEQTRKASYLFYPDIPNPSIIDDPGFFEAAKSKGADGSAFGVSDSGLVFTAAHMVTETNFCTAANEPAGVARAAKKRPTYCTLITQTYERVFRAQVLRVDEAMNIAVLQIVNPPKHLPYLEIAQEGKFKIGAEVLTVGAPLRNANFMTIGYITNLEDVDPETHEKFLQFSGLIQKGNSGGPLVDVASGKVVGMIEQVYAHRTSLIDGGQVTEVLIPTGISYATRADVLRNTLREFTKSK